MTEPYIFISHKSTDKPRIRPIVEWLLKRGFSLWIDNPEHFKPRLSHKNLRGLRIGTNFRKNIPERIAEAACVLVIWSIESVESSPVCAEANRALKQEKLVPIRIDRVELPFGFEDIKTTDLTDELSNPSKEPDLQSVSDDIKELIEENHARQPEPRFEWGQYEDLFKPGDYRIAFLPFLNPQALTASKFKLEATSVIRDSSDYELPLKFESTQIDQPFADLPSCRLVHFALQHTPRRSSKIELTFSKIKYSDYLKSGEHLDDPLPNDPERTFREEFAKLIPKPDFNLRHFPLTNICGVGLFVVTRDQQVLICRHTANAHVYPLRWTFSASGTMRWGACPNPFSEVMWKSREEINHQINPAKLELVELGADARKLYFEFCFLERTELTSAELAKNLPESLEHEMVPLGHLKGFVERIVTGCWEPAAEATLLTLAIENYGRDNTLRALNEQKDRWKQHQMLDEWDLRASRHGSLAVMSVRYPVQKLERASSNYVTKVMRFIGSDINGKRVIEIGSGIGRITRQLVKKCKHVTCVDLCERMHQRNAEHLGAAKGNVWFEKRFIQEFELAKKGRRYDVAVCSLVLIHNVDPHGFETAVAVICSCADVVFVFEDVTQGRRTSSHTRLISEARLTAVFARFGFVVQRETHHNLFEDAIAFLKFVRAGGAV